MKALVGAFNQEKALVGAFSVIVKTDCETDGSFNSTTKDVKYWAEFQTGVKIFEPWMRRSEDRRVEGLCKPCSLVEACEILGDCKNLQD